MINGDNLKISERAIISPNFCLYIGTTVCLLWVSYTYYIGTLNCMYIYIFIEISATIYHNIMAKIIKFNLNKI